MILNWKISFHFSYSHSPGLMKGLSLLSPNYTLALSPSIPTATCLGCSAAISIFPSVIFHLQARADFHGLRVPSHFSLFAFNKICKIFFFFLIGLKSPGGIDICWPFWPYLPLVLTTNSHSMSTKSLGYGKVLSCPRDFCTWCFLSLGFLSLPFVLLI